MSTVRTLLVAVVLTCLIVPSVSFAESDEASMFAQARNHFQESNYYFASTWLERILRNFPATPQREEVLMMLAKSYAATSRDEKAIRTLKTLLKDFPKAAGKLEPGLLKMVQDPAQQAPQLAEPQTPPASAQAAPPAPVESKPDKLEPSAAVVPPAPVKEAPAPPVKAPEASVEAEKSAPVAVPTPAPVPVDTAATEKAAAEKAAAEKAAAEKAAAEKAAAEKAAAEKAAAEKAAAEKAAAEKAAEPVKAAAVSEPALKPGPAPVEATPPVIAAAPVAPPERQAAPADIPEPPKAVPAPSEQALQSAPATRDVVGGGYTLDLGTYVLKSEMVGIKKKIVSAGMKPVVEPGPKKMEQMSRIHAGEYADQKAAEKMLQKLRKAKVECFILQDKAGKFNVYAGSYFDKLGAVDEQLRLAGFGITTELRQITVQVPTFVLTAGSFKSQEAAARKGAELERLGVKPTVVQRPSAK